MRVFLAINFEESVKQQFTEVINLLRLQVTEGRFVAKDNLHLTLEFLGDVENDRLKIITDIMDSVDAERFVLSLTEMSHFKTRRGKICWLGMEKNQNLLDLQHHLHLKLAKHHFELEDRDYLPHITVGRKVKLEKNANLKEMNQQVGGINIPVSTFELMESKVVDGQLTYSTIHSKRLM